jgi:hypothetical protein
MSYFPERRFPRVEFQPLPLVFSLRLPEAAPADRPLRLEARNVSRGGIKFFCNRRFPLFDTLELHFFEKGTGKPLPPLRGKVVRVEEIDTGYGERTYGIALEFTAGTECLSSLLPAPPSPAPGK